MDDSHSLDRDLLMGILAVQLDFISLAQLGDALGMRLDHQARSLGELLIGQNAISTDDQAILEALVTRRLAQHDNEASRGLESLELSEKFHRFLDDLAVPELSTRISQISSRAETGEDLTVSFDNTSFGSSTDRYRILQFHKGGGLGQVLLAKDTILNREVALKRIHPSRADHPQSRSRLRLEAEVTGRLEHPGIVPVYDLGRYESGRPFYVMRFIRGESLKDRIKQFHRQVENGQYSAGERTVEFRKLLGHLIDVCEAAAYAHSRGTIHRDIKPSNIMLGDYGETLLVDWGLTKIIGKGETFDTAGQSTLRPGIESGEPTAEGDALGTLPYMSPEQASGQVDVLTGQSDVYSLGATLYHVLTSHPPFAAETGDCRLKIMRGEFTPPEQMNPALPRQLASICRKAMQREPEQRYQSAKHLAADIERWLADEPVVAHPESRIERTHRFYRKHRTAVTMAGMFLLISTLGLLAATAIITGKNIKLQRAVAQANDERVRAEGNAEVARQFAEELLDTADQRLSQIPNQLVPRVILTNLAADRVADLFSQNPQDASIRMFFARSLLTRANLLRSTNEKTRAEADYEQAIKHYRALIDHPDHGPAVCDYLAGALIDYAEYLAETRLAEAEGQLIRADEIMTAIPDQGTANFQRTRARFLTGRASVLFDTGDTERAAMLFKEAADIFRSLVDRKTYALDPNLLLDALESHAETLVVLERLDDALEVLDEAAWISHEYFEKRASRDDKNMRAHILLDRGKLLLKLNQDEPQGIESIQDAIEIWETLLHDFPRYRRYDRSIVDAHIALAEYYIPQGALETAGEHVRNAEQRLEAYSAEQLFRRSRVNLLACQARLRAARQEWELAEQSLLKAIDQQMNVVSDKPGNVVEQRRLLKLQEQLGELTRQRQAGD